MYLEQDLAQQISERTMNVLKKNINIMDGKGIIIGSGNKERLGHYHEVAEKVLETGKRFVITGEQARFLQGVEAGINLPIKFNNEIIGVVGITGEPSEVAAYGEIVKNLVELMLAHDFLKREIELKKQAMENFYQQLIGKNLRNLGLLADRAKLFNIEPDSPRRVLVIKIDPFNNVEINHKIQYLNRHLVSHNEQDIFFIRGENLIFIKTVEMNAEGFETTAKLAKEIHEQLEQDFESVQIGVGQIADSLAHLHFSYEGAKYALKVSTKEVKTKIHFVDNLACDYLVPYINERAARYFLASLFKGRVEEVFAETTTGSVIEGLLDNSLNLSRTAEQLYIHRNTLLYRLDKIKDTIGLDPKNTKDLFTLFLAYRIYLYYN